LYISTSEDYLGRALEICASSSSSAHRNRGHWNKCACVVH